MVTEADVRALAKGMGPVIRAYVTKALDQRDEALRRELGLQTKQEQQPAARPRVRVPHRFGIRL